MNKTIAARLSERLPKHGRDRFDSGQLRYRPNNDDPADFFLLLVHIPAGFFLCCCSTPRLAGEREWQGSAQGNASGRAVHCGTSLPLARDTSKAGIVCGQLLGVRISQTYVRAAGCATCSARSAEPVPGTWGPRLGVGSCRTSVLITGFSFYFDSATQRCRMIFPAPSAFATHPPPACTPHLPAARLSSFPPGL